MPGAQRNEIDNPSKFKGWEVFLSAEPVRTRDTETQNAPRRVLLVDTVRATGLERHDFHVPGLRAIDGRDAPTRERVKRLERVIRRLAGTDFRGGLHGALTSPQPRGITLESRRGRFHGNAASAGQALVIS